MFVLRALFFEFVPYLKQKIVTCLIDTPLACGISDPAVVRQKYASQKNPGVMFIECQDLVCCSLRKASNKTFCNCFHEIDTVIQIESLSSPYKY